MLLGFKRRFEPMVMDGSKTHTMRAKRKIRPRVGETCHCYVDPRQKSMRVLGRWPCVRVEDVLIYERGDGTLNMFVEGVELTLDEKNAFAWRDGFRSRGKRRARGRNSRNSGSPNTARRGARWISPATSSTGTMRRQSSPACSLESASPRRVHRGGQS